MDQEIQKLVEEGKRTVQAEREAEAEVQRAALQEEKEKETMALAIFLSQMAGQIPTVLLPHIEPVTRIGKKWSILIQAEMPYMLPVVMQLQMNRDGQWKFDGVYNVLDPVGLEDLRYCHEQKIDWRNRQTGGLSRALYWAASGYEAQQELLAEIRRLDALDEIAQAEYEAEDDARQREYETKKPQEKQAANDKRSRLLAAVENDQVLRAVIDLVIAIQAEREVFQKDIESRDGELDAIESGYETKIRQEREARDQARNEANEERQRAFDAELEVEKVKRGLRAFS